MSMCCFTGEVSPKRQISLSNISYKNIKIICDNNHINNNNNNDKLHLYDALHDTQSSLENESNTLK